MKLKFKDLRYMSWGRYFKVWHILFPVLLFGIAFTLHYFLVLENMKEIYLNTNDSIKIKIISEEKLVFRDNLIGNGILYILQVLGFTLIFNIGFLALDYKFNFNKLSSVIINSSIALIVIYFVIPIFLITTNYSYSFTSLYNIETSLTLAHFVKENTATWLKNFLEIFSFSQLFFIILIINGFKKMMKWKTKKATLNTLKIYGIGLFIWSCFSIIMDLNFINY